METSASLKGLKILVVEDEFLVAMQLTRMIEQMGGEVIGPASTLTAATELLQSTNLDGAVLDVKLGDESSTSLAENLLSLGVPLVLTTGYTGELLPESLAQLPRLTKPYTSNGFQAIAATCFRRR